MYKDSKALEEAIQEFIFTRQEEEGGVDYAVKLVGKQKEYERQWLLIKSYTEILEALLPNERHEVDALSSAYNGVAAIVAESEYRRGFMDAFHIFRMLLDKDDRRTVKC